MDKKLLHEHEKLKDPLVEADKAIAKKEEEEKKIEDKKKEENDKKEAEASQKRAEKQEEAKGKKEVKKTDATLEKAKTETAKSDPNKPINPNKQKPKLSKEEEIKQIKAANAEAAKMKEVDDQTHVRAALQKGKDLVQEMRHDAIIDELENRKQDADEDM